MVGSETSQLPPGTPHRLGKLCSLAARRTRRRRRLGAANEEYANTKAADDKVGLLPVSGEEGGEGECGLRWGSEVPLSCECELADTEHTRRGMIGILKSLKMWLQVVERWRKDGKELRGCQ